YLETVAQADTVVFDKTGTLTHACPVVAEVIPFGGQNEADMLRLAACLEEHFPHSMANAVVHAARERGLSHEEMHSEVEYIVAHGIASEVNGRRVIIGSAHFVFEDEHCTIPEGEQERYDFLPDQYSHLYLATGGVLSAVVCISDPLRPEAGDVIRRLRDLGIRRAVMLTGDSERTAAAIAAEVGVDEYHAEILPADKASFVEAERAKGHIVIMIGDGINDSPALSKANVGIAISDGAAIAREIADITIGADDLHELVSLRRLAGRLTERIRSNYRFVMGFNGALIALGALGVLPPATSAMLHNLSTLGVSLRSMTNLLESG
ncbi:MAG: HAD-IC family P-type ATPase, partial [Oscillospiraceae bacterium]|nr:HAD-IC family P-type ATPase [Oscillospiraceae bacterium]